MQSGLRMYRNNFFINLIVWSNSLEIHVVNGKELIESVIVWIILPSLRIKRLVLNGEIDSFFEVVSDTCC